MIRPPVTIINPLGDPSYVLSNSMYLTSERDLYSCEATLQKKAQKKFRGSNRIQTHDLHDTGLYHATKRLNIHSNVLDICISNGAFYFPRYQCRSITSSWITPYHRQSGSSQYFHHIFFSLLQRNRSHL